MPSARFALSVFANDTVLVACGGGLWMADNENPYPCTTVEVYNTETKAWSVARDLPRFCAAMSVSMAGDICYMLGDVDNYTRTGPIFADIRKILKPKIEEPVARGFGRPPPSN